MKLCNSLWTKKSKRKGHSKINEEIKRNLYTVRMIEMPRFYVGKLLLHNYKSDLAHISDLYSLVIELYKSER